MAALTNLEKIAIQIEIEKYQALVAKQKANPNGFYSYEFTHATLYEDRSYITQNIHTKQYQCTFKFVDKGALSLENTETRLKDFGMMKRLTIELCRQLNELGGAAPFFDEV